MAKPSIVRSLAWRKLERGVHRYIKIEADDILMAALEQRLEIVPEEIILGFYFNNICVSNENFYVSTHALYFYVGANVVRLTYDDMMDIKSPGSKEMHVPKNLTITMQDQTVYIIPVTGSPGRRLQDMWPVLQFLRLASDFFEKQREAETSVL